MSDDKCEECGCADFHACNGCGACDNCTCTAPEGFYEGCLSRQLRSAESRIAALEAELARATEIADSALLLLEARQHLQNEPDSLRWLGIQREATAKLRGPTLAVRENGGGK